MTPRTDADLELQQFLEMMAYAESTRTHDLLYRGPADFCLQHARFYTPRPLPVTVPPMQPRMCFDNAYRLASDPMTGLRYVEGFALGVIPCPHAWLVEDADVVIDPTWALTEPPVGSSYCGVEIPLEDVFSARLSGCASVLQNYHDKWRFFRKRFTPHRKEASDGTVDQSGWHRIDGPAGERP